VSREGDPPPGELNVKTGPPLADIMIFSTVCFKVVLQARFCLQQIITVQQARPGTVVAVQQAKNWNKYCDMENKPKFENTQQLQAQSHFRS